MAEIMGMGLSHYPGPVSPAKYWSRMVARNVEVGRIKREFYEDKNNWPKAMIEEWSDDQGLAAAEEHRRRLLAGYKALRDELDAFKPDIVLIWGDDQYENFKRDGVPAFAVGIFDLVESRPFGGGKQVFQTTENVWGLSEDTVMPIKGHRRAAADLTRYLIENQYDMAYLLETRHRAGLAHSFNNTVLYLDYDNHGDTWPYPVIPFHVNCYGSDLMKTAAGMVGEGEDVLSPPAPTPRRCFDIGKSIARFFKDSPWRVAMIGSSSWSHGSLTKKHGRLYPDLEADQRRYDELKDGRFRNWGKLTEEEIDDAGQHELSNWICLAGAMTELDRSAEIVDFVPSNLFNSSKCFAVFPAPGVQRPQHREAAAAASA